MKHDHKKLPLIHPAQHCLLFLNSFSLYGFRQGSFPTIAGDTRDLAGIFWMKKEMIHHWAAVSGEQPVSYANEPGELILHLWKRWLIRGWNKVGSTPFFVKYIGNWVGELGGSKLDEGVFGGGTCWIPPYFPGQICLHWSTWGYTTYTSWQKSEVTCQAHKGFIWGKSANVPLTWRGPWRPKLPRKVQWRLHQHRCTGLLHRERDRIDLFYSLKKWFLITIQINQPARWYI